MLDETFAESVVHRQPPFLARAVATALGRRPVSAHVVLGARLRPFSLWHCFALDAFKSPFAGHEAPIDFANVFIASRLCALAYPRIHLAGPAHALDRKLAAWRHGLLRSDFARRFALNVAIARFFAYMKDYSGGPIHAAGENSSPVKSPWYLYQVTLLLQRDRRLTKADAWNMPVSESQWWTTALAESSGVPIDILTPEDRAQLADMEKESARESRE